VAAAITEAAAAVAVTTAEAVEAALMAVAVEATQEADADKEKTGRRHSQVCFILYAIFAPRFNVQVFPGEQLACFG
jgi:hypothetical protein